MIEIVQYANGTSYPHTDIGSTFNTQPLCLRISYLPTRDRRDGTPDKPVYGLVIIVSREPINTFTDPYGDLGI